MHKLFNKTALALALCSAFYTYEASADNSIALSHIEFATTGNILKLPYLSQIADKYKGRNIDAYMLQNILQEVTDYYRENGYPSSRAYLPEQSIGTDGVLLVDIVYTKISDINLNIDSKFLARGTSKMLFKHLKSLRHSDVHTNDLQKELLKLSDLGAFDIKASMQEDADDLSHAVIDVDIKERKKFTGALMADNYGSKSVGEYRFMGYTTISNLTQHADSMSVFLATTQKNYKNYNINYEIPVNSYKTVLGLGSCYSHYELSDEYEFLDAKGSSLTGEIFLKQPLLRSFDTKADIFVGYRYRDIKDEFGLFDIEFKKHSHAIYASVAGSHKFTDNLSGSATGKFTFGRLYSDDEYDMAFDDKFIIFNTTANINYRINDYVSAISSFEAQMASVSLDASESFTISGAEAVAAYKSNKAAGDYGYILRCGMQFNPIKDSSLSLTPNLSYGHSGYKGFAQTTSLKGLGLDADYSYKGFFTKVQAAAALGNKTKADDSALLWVRFGYSFI